MKKIFITAALLMLAQLTFAQAEHIKVNNLSDCPIYISLRLSEPADPCRPVYESDVFIVPPHTVNVYDYTSYPGSTATSAQYFLYAKVFQGPLDCGGMGDAVGVGETCYTFPQSDMLLAHEINCSVCDNVTAIWYPEPNPSGFAVLEIAP